MTNSKKLAKSHRDLEVYRIGFEAAMTIFDFSKSFPSEERYSLNDQVRRSSRSVCTNLAEAWRRRSYEGNFLLRLNDAEAEAAETQTWLEFTVKSNYLKPDEARDLYKTYERIISMLVKMRQNPKPWLFP
jgi:four helix bundle protein